MAAITATYSGEDGMELGLTGKVALITGGTSGIGLAIAQTLAAEGCNVAICGRDKAKLDSAVAAVKSAEAKGFVADVCKPADVAALVDNVTKACGGIDIVVSNAGTHLPGRLDEIDERGATASLPDQGARRLGTGASRGAGMRKNAEAAASSSSSARPARCRRPTSSPRP